MATTTHSAYGTTTSALGTELDALPAGAGSNVTAASAAIDNTTSKSLYADFVLVLGVQLANRSAGAKLEIFFAYAIDGLVYDTLLAAYKQPAATFTLDSATATAVQTSVVNVEIPPGLFKVYARNLTGQALAATGNTIRYRFHSVQTL